jgi:RNA polymerase sigma-70 factor (ECF subfamily)
LTSREGRRRLAEQVRGQAALGGASKDTGQLQPESPPVGSCPLPGARRDESEGKLITEAALATEPATIGFTGRTTVNTSPEMLRKTKLAVARAKEGDQDALRFLYVSYSHNIYGYVRSIVRDDHEAEDVTQHVFAKLMTTIGKYNDRGVPFFAWLLRLARNVAVDHLRGNRMTPTETVLDADLSSAGDIDEGAAVWEALASLPEEQREVVVLRHVVGLTPGEIAERLGRSEGSIHGLHHRGRRALQKELTLNGSTPCTRNTPRLAAA